MYQSVFALFVIICKVIHFATKFQPARKDLLLNKYFDNVDTQSSSINTTRDISLQNLKKQGIDLKGKRKDLPDNVRRKLEQTQREAVQAYKLLKINQLKNK